ncbi:MAG: hypothetical protein K0S04_2660 [Herbinix sp.]|jgi:hypothetical protein|nr:hypothetical protein [Herbinix sp.]
MQQRLFTKHCYRYLKSIRAKKLFLNKPLNNKSEPVGIECYKMDIHK